MNTFSPDRSRLIPPKAGGPRRKWKKLRACAIQVVMNRGLTLCPESIAVWIGVLTYRDTCGTMITKLAGELL